MYPVMGGSGMLFLGDGEIFWGGFVLAYNFLVTKGWNSGNVGNELQYFCINGMTNETFG